MRGHITCCISIGPRPVYIDYLAQGDQGPGVYSRALFVGPFQRENSTRTTAAIDACRSQRE
jgi:hypothetical protein